MEFKYQLSNWDYVVESYLPLHYSVHPSTKIEYPRELMKYYRINENSIEAITQNYFYASHPLELNDPFDCFQNLLDYNNVSLDTYNRFYRNNPQNTASKIKMLYEENNEFLKENFKVAYHDYLFNKLGVISLTSNQYDMLMWAHYSNHSGFLAVYDIEQLKKQFHGPFPINYVESAEQFDLNVNPHLAVLYMTNIKSKCWSYEKEWRLIAETPHNFRLPHRPDLTEFIDRKVTYPEIALKEVVLGFDFCNNRNSKGTIKDGYTVLDFTGLKDANLRVELLEYIIKYNIPVSSIHLNNSLEFKLLKGDLDLRYFDKNKYGFKQKHVA